MPAANPALDVWLYGDLIGILTATNRRQQQMRLDFSAATERRFGPGSLVLSCSMPVGLARRPNGASVRAFFAGLLPEGDARRMVERELGVTPGDSFGLLEAIGRDCARSCRAPPLGLSCARSRCRARLRHPRTWRARAGDRFPRRPSAGDRREGADLPPRRAGKARPREDARRRLGAPDRRACNDAHPQTGEGEPPRLRGRRGILPSPRRAPSGSRRSTPT